MKDPSLRPRVAPNLADDGAVGRCGSTPDKVPIVDLLGTQHCKSRASRQSIFVDERERAVFWTDGRSRESYRVCEARAGRGSVRFPKRRFSRSRCNPILRSLDRCMLLFVANSWTSRIQGSETRCHQVFRPPIPPASRLSPSPPSGRETGQQSVVATLGSNCEGAG